MNISIKNLDKLLDYETIKIMPKPQPARGFDRNRYFKIDKWEYRIEWFINQSYLYAPGNVTIPFNNIKRLNTWPHKSKMDLMFIDQKGSTVAVLKIEFYE